jgi:HEAT repeat protein
MSDETNARRDTRTVDELVSAALCEVDEEAHWDAVNALQDEGSREVLQRASDLCGSPCSRERCLAADVLGQLGVPERTFPDECVALLLAMIESERNPMVLQAVLVEFSHLNDRAAIDAASKFVAHADPDVRHAAVLALTGHDERPAIQMLIALTEDPVPNVRDWATFALGTQTDADTPEIREALVRRLEDSDEVTRGEAFVGLARRKDRRVVPAVADELRGDCVGRLAVEAAELIAAPELHPDLVELLDWWDVDTTLLQRAIAACSPARNLGLN